MNLQKITRKTLRQTVYEELKHKIIFGEILPGQLLTLNSLAKELGVSFMPVREALWQLESEKIVMIESNKGIRVNSLTAAEMEEALELRLMLEARAAERACDRLTESNLSEIKRVLDRMEASVGETEMYLLLNWEFHLTIYSSADSPMLLQLINSIWARINPYRHTLVAKFGDHSISMKCHQGMYTALIQRDKKKLNESIHQDLEMATKLIMANFGHFSEKGEVT